MPMKVCKAVFPAAGLGTRFLPATKAQPKEMLPIVDKPIIQYGVEEALAAGCDQIIIVTGRGKSSMRCCLLMAISTIPVACLCSHGAAIARRCSLHQRRST